jgi:hypothetical protein
MKDAYKNIPAKMEELRLQGFIWLGKFFVELKQTFGALTSVSNFDVLGNTVQTLARAASNLPRNWCQRQLDDNPVVAPAGTGWCESYSEDYEKICETINIKLAEECPKKDKAFKNEQEGKVLGIWFDSKEMKWSLPYEKAEKARRAIFETFHAETASLHSLQSLVGRLNDVALMCPFLTAFRKNISELLAKGEESPSDNIIITEKAKDDLLIWWAAIEDSEKRLAYPKCPLSTKFVLQKVCDSYCYVIFMFSEQLQSNRFRLLWRKRRRIFPLLMLLLMGQGSHVHRKRLQLQQANQLHGDDSLHSDKQRITEEPAHCVCD